MVATTESGTPPSSIRVQAVWRRSWKRTLTPAIRFAVAQALFPLWSSHPAAAGLRVHLSNGLYVNAALDRMLGGWTLRKSS